MKVRGYQVTDAQLSAGVAVMTGVFRTRAVLQALLDAGVPASLAGSVSGRIVQKYRQARLIRRRTAPGWYIAN